MLGMLAMVVTFVVVAPGAAQAADTAPLAMCAHPSNTIVTNFPQGSSLGPSSRYSDGPRTCSYYTKRAVSYYCLGNYHSETYINIINNPTGARKVYYAVCDGTLRTFVAAHYPAGSGPYHVHWHVNIGSYTGSYMKIA
ncbi:hypothetical protein [Micromonospora sp. LOL_024]|uniref:hypothetical protein n=1 Tax=Micromonospora sp. LOL_024 TaxID=3345412 RepID=UPI003A86177E